MRSRVRDPFAVAVLAATVLTFATAASAQSGRDVRIEVLSSRADMVSGGDALVQVTAPAAARVTVNGRDVSAAFKPGATAGTQVGLVEGLVDGKNTLRAEAGRASAQLVLVNYPVQGPIFAGPFLTPFRCMTEENGLGAALDASCSAATKVEYFYKSNAMGPSGPAIDEGDPIAAAAARAALAAQAAARAGGGAAGAGGGGGGGGGRGGQPPSPFKPLPTGAALPADLDQVKLPDGRTVPYIVRVESGTINRAVYRIAVLDDPRQSTATNPWKAGAAWNGRLVYSFGGGCGVNYNQGRNTAVGAINDDLMRRGFAHATSTANVLGQFCDDHRSGETLMMVKEHFIERFGVPAWTMGMGGSGGAMQQNLITQNFPGLLDGTLPSRGFADMFSLWNSLHDCNLMARYFEGSGKGWPDAKRDAVRGATLGTCEGSAGYLNSDTATRVQSCGIPAEQVYDPVKNPKGARCTTWDTNVNTFGRDPKTGFGRRTYDNVGIQYGLLALQAGTITPAEFLDLNAKFGGFDNDGGMADQRSAADPEAVRLAYAAGRINTAGGATGSIPILHYRNYTDGQRDVHDRFREFQIRDRIEKAYGRSDNQVIWLTTSGPPLQAVENLAIDTMTQWLDALVKDTSRDKAITKVVRAKPASAVDACWDREGKRIDEKFTRDPSTRCNTLYPPHTNIHIAAGGPLADAWLKCQLKQPKRSDYANFSDAEWQQLKSIFPSGVCDFSKPGLNQGTIAGTYQWLPLKSSR